MASDIVSRRTDALAALTAAARERILVLDGAMGTQIQGLGFDEAHFRGHRFGACDHHQQGNNDLLILTQPEAIEAIHFAYAMAGADLASASVTGAPTFEARSTSMLSGIMPISGIDRISRTSSTLSISPRSARASCCRHTRRRASRFR